MICHSRDNVHQIHWLHVTSIIENMFTYRVWKKNLNRFWSKKAKLSQAEPIRGKPSRAMPSQAEPCQAELILPDFFFLTDIVWDLLKKQSNMLHKRYHVHCTTQEAPSPTCMIYQLAEYHRLDWDEPWNQTYLVLVHNFVKNLALLSYFFLVLCLAISNQLASCTSFLGFLHVKSILFNTILDKFCVAAALSKVIYLMPY